MDRAPSRQGFACRSPVKKHASTHRVEAVLDPLLFLLEQQEKEHRALEAGWAKREKAVRQAIVSVAVLYGGVNGIIGGTMPKIERLELPPPKEDQAA